MTPVRVLPLVVAALCLAACAPAPVPLSQSEFTTAYGSTDATWLPLPESPLSPRSDATGVAVDHRFFVAGGNTGFVCPPSASCIAPTETASDGAIFAPETGSWTKIADAPIPFISMSAATVTQTVYVLAAGTEKTDWTSSVLAYDLVDDSWSTLPPVRSEALVAAGSELLAISGSDEIISSIDARYDAETNSWIELPDDPLGPSFDREAVWLGDRLLLTAKDLVPNPGSDQPTFVRLATLDVATNTWTVLPDTDIIGWSPRVAGQRVVFPTPGSADGGQIGNWGRDVPYGGIYDAAGGTWHPLGVSDDGPATVVGDRIVIGSTLLDLVSKDTSSLPALPGANRLGATFVGSDEALLVWGGSIGEHNLNDGYLIIP